MRHALVSALLLALLAAVALTESGAQEHVHAVSTVQTVVGVGPAWNTLKSEVGSSYSGTVSHHMMDDAYPKVLAWSDPGDTFVFMFAFDLDEQRVPEEYHDMLPKSWTEIESRVKQGETLELTGEARGLHVVLLAAPTMRELEGLIRSTDLLDEVRGPVSGDPAPHRSHTPHGNLSSGDRPNVFVMAPYSLHLFQHVLGVLGESVYNRTGRNHTTENYDGIWDGTHNHSPQDLVVLLFAMDSTERIPEKYADLLPRPWKEIEDALRIGETVELEGQARDVRVILLAAPNASKLKRSVIESKRLHAYNAAYQKLQSPAIDLVLASDAVELRPYDEGGLYSATVVIGNIGTKESPSFGVHFVITRGTDTKTKTMTHGTGPIWPDDHWNEMSMPFALEEGINDIAVIVDPDDDIPETNETNNRASLRVVVKGGRIVESTELR